MNGDERRAGDGGDTVADVTHHIKGVLEAAERAAAASVEQARAEGARRVGEAKQRAQELVDERRARINAISDDLLSQAEAVETRLAKLDDALSTAMEELRREIDRLPKPPATGESEDEVETGLDQADDDFDGNVDSDPGRAVSSR